MITDDLRALGTRHDVAYGPGLYDDWRECWQARYGARYPWGNAWAWFIWLTTYGQKESDD